MRLWLYLAAVLSLMPLAALACSSSPVIDIVPPPFDAGTDSTGDAFVLPDGFMFPRDAGVDSSEAATPEAGDAGMETGPACDLPDGAHYDASGQCSFGNFDTTFTGCGMRVEVDCQSAGGAGTPPTAYPTLPLCAELDAGSQAASLGDTKWSCPYPSPCVRRAASDTACASLDAGTALAWVCAPGEDGGVGSPPSPTCQYAFDLYCCP